jgi:hypothetical protein
VHISRDAGTNWQDVTPKGIKEFSQINSMETDPFNAGGIYLAATRYKWGDFEPYLYHSNNYGKSWERIDQGLNREHFTRVIRCDPDHQGLLFAGTEYGLYLSVDAGQNWQEFQMNLPLTPITDLAVKDRHLIAATQGRGFWILDDLSPLYEMDGDFKSSAHLFKPKPSYLMQSSYGGKSKSQGENHPNGVIVNYYLETADTANETYALNFYNKRGEMLRSFSSNAKDKANRWVPKEGGGRFIWNMREAGYDPIEGMILWNVLRQGPYVLPGLHSVEMLVGEKSLKQDFELILDPRVSEDENGLAEQHQYLHEVKEGMAEMNTVILEIRRVREDLNSLAGRCADTSLLASIKEHIQRGEEIEKALYQTQNRSPQDPLNYPVRLNNKYGHLGALAAIGFNAPTASMIGVKDELEKEIQTQVSLWKKQKEDLQALNTKILASDIDLIKWGE